MANVSACGTLCAACSRTPTPPGDPRRSARRSFRPADLNAGVSARAAQHRRGGRGATMTAASHRKIIAASSRNRLDLFLATANRLGAPIGNVEKDFWICWTLNALYHERPAGGPRILFNGGTSLSKAYGLIRRFSDDFDITVFRDDLDEPASVEELEQLSNKKRRARLDAIRDTCRAYIAGPLREFLGAKLADTTGASQACRDRRSGSGRSDLARLVSRSRTTRWGLCAARRTDRIRREVSSRSQPSGHDSALHQ